MKKIIAVGIELYSDKELRTAIVRMIKIIGTNMQSDMSMFWGSPESISFLRSKLETISVRTSQAESVKCESDPELDTIDLTVPWEFDDRILSDIIDKYGLRFSESVDTSIILAGVPAPLFTDFVKYGITSGQGTFLLRKLHELESSLGKAFKDILIGFRFTNEFKVFVPTFHIDFINRFSQQQFSQKDKHSNFILSNGPQTKYVISKEALKVPHIHSELSPHSLLRELLDDKLNKMPYVLYVQKYLFDMQFVCKSMTYELLETTPLEWNKVPFDFIHRSATRHEAMSYKGARFCVLAYPDPSRKEQGL